MARKTCFSIEIQRAGRGECYVCRPAKKNCLCGSIKPFATKMRFVILMHPKEDRKQRSGTARLARLCLKNAELLTGIDFTRDARLKALLGDPAYHPFVLYPGHKTVNFKTLGREPVPEGKTPLVFVVDGTWRGARSIVNKSANLRALPRLSFSGSYISRFVFKKQPKPHCVSTIEAVHYLCAEAEEAGYEKLNGRHKVLMSVFKELVDTQVNYAEAGKSRARVC